MNIDVPCLLEANETCYTSKLQKIKLGRYFIKNKCLRTSAIGYKLPSLNVSY